MCLVEGETVGGSYRVQPLRLSIGTTAHQNDGTTVISFIHPEISFVLLTGVVDFIFIIIIIEISILYPHSRIYIIIKKKNTSQQQQNNNK